MEEGGTPARKLGTVLPVLLLLPYWHKKNLCRQWKGFVTL